MGLHAQRSRGVLLAVALFILTLPNLAAAAPSISSISSPVVVGDSFTIDGSGFTNGSVINFFVATAAGAVNFGPLNPATPISPTELSVLVPTSISGAKPVSLGEGVVAVQVVNTDQGFAASNTLTTQLFGDNADGFPNLTGINGIGLSVTSADPGIATDNVEIHLLPGTTITLNGNGFDSVNGVAVDLFCDCPGGKIPTIRLSPGNAGLTTTALTIALPATGAGGPVAGPGSFVISNRGAAGDYAIKSNAVSVPIGSPVTVTSVEQTGCTVTVNGTGFAINGSGLPPNLTVINLFNPRGGAVINLGGLSSIGAPRIPLSITSSTQFTFSLSGTGFVPGPSYVQVLNPPFISFTSSGDAAGGAFTAAECAAATPTPTPSAAAPSPTPTAILPTPSPTATPISPLFSQACSSQTMIGIDPINNIAYVPVYSLDKAGNAQLAVVDLTVGAGSAVLKTISLAGSVQPISVTYNPFNRTMLAQSRTAENQIFIYEINTITHSVVSMVVAAGLVQQTGSEVSQRPAAGSTGEADFSNARWSALARALQTRRWAKMRRAELSLLLRSQPSDNGSWGPIVRQPTSGGIIEDLKNNRAIVAGTNALGILDTSKSPPVWDSHSVVDLDLDAESITLNANTGLLFISNLGSDDLIDTTKSPLSEIPFQRVPNKGVSDGVAFDSITNIVIHTEFDGADKVYAFNFGTLDITQNPATADPIGVQGLGFQSAYGLESGPGGQNVVNCVTHQAVIADEFGPNFKLIQMPSQPISGALDNNGQPGSGTVPDAASVYTITAAVIPQTLVGGIESPLGAIDSPSTLTIDPSRNFAYMLADDWLFYHLWTPGSTLPLFLVRVDLSKPVFGASPTGGIDGKTFWTPTAEVIPLP